MTGDPRRPTRLEPVDDATIEQLVLDVAAGWTMPPVRLDAPSWRDRVRSPRARRIEGARGWLGRLGQAATAAIALTVVGSLAAVLLTRPPVEPGASPDATDGESTPRPTAAAASTPLPRLHLDGDVPVPSIVLTEIEEGGFSLVDLATGERGPSLTTGAFGSSLRWRADGTLICLCVKTAGDDNGRPTEAEISLDRLDAGGNVASTIPVAHLVGEPDPRDGSIQERPPHVTFDVRFSEGGRFGFIGWSVRNHPVWSSGVTVIDLSDGHEVSRIELPDDTSGEGDTRRVVTAPRLLGTGADGTVVIAREWYSWSPPGSQGENYRQATDVFGASIAGGVLSSVAPLDGVDGCGERVIRAGTVGDGGSWLVCARALTSEVIVRRVGADGTVAGDTPVSIAPGVDGDTVAPSEDGRSLFVWNAATATLTRVDLVTGDAIVGQGLPAGAAAPGPLTAVGAWLAPNAAAKSFLYGGVVVSPDGTRVYAAGINAGINVEDMAGSSGIFVFDAASLTSLGRWEPTADYISLGVSSDGRSVYAAGLPRVDASGQSRPGQQASITVHAASDGAVRLIAGELGGQFLLFPEPILD